MSFGFFFSTLNPTLMTYSFNTTNTYKTMHEVITYSLMQSQKSNLQIYFNKFIKTISNPLINSMATPTYPSSGTPNYFLNTPDSVKPVCKYKK